MMLGDTIEDKKVIGMYEIEINTSVGYMVNSLLNILNRWQKIKIYVVENKEVKQ